MNWQQLILNVIGNLSAQGGAIAFVPQKYQPVVMAALAFVGAMIALFQQAPHKQDGKIDISKAPVWILVLLLGSVASGCGTLVSMKPPSVLTPPPAGLSISSDITDYDVLYFSDQIYQTFSMRAFRAEAGDLGGGVAVATLSTGAAIASKSGAAAETIAMLATIGSWIANLNTLINPQLRATILSEGGGLVLDAQTTYFQERTAAGIQKTSHKVLTAYGAKLLGSVNSAIRVTSTMLVGMAPRFSDYARLAPTTVTITPPTPAQVSAINAEPAAAGTAPAP